MAEAMYAATAAEAGVPGDDAGAGDSTDDGDVIDADFEEAQP
jgi:hypothetical protein